MEPTLKPPMSAADMSIRRHRITVDEYYRMAEVGLLAPDARVELIEGGDCGCSSA